MSTFPAENPGPRRRHLHCPGQRRTRSDGGRPGGTGATAPRPASPTSSDRILGGLTSRTWPGPLPKARNHTRPETAGLERRLRSRTPGREPQRRGTATSRWARTDRRAAPGTREASAADPGCFLRSRPTSAAPPAAAPSHPESQRRERGAARRRPTRRGVRPARAATPSWGAVLPYRGGQPAVGLDVGRRVGPRGGDHGHPPCDQGRLVVHGPPSLPLYGAGGNPSRCPQPRDAQPREHRRDR